MTKRLFIDVDDTLIKYKNDAEMNPYGFWKGDPYEPNFELIEAIKEYRKKYPDALIVIWSGGGKPYARAAADHLFPGNDFTTMEKGWDYFPLVRDTDIVVDDFAPSMGDHPFDVHSPEIGAALIREEISASETKTH